MNPQKRLCISTNTVEFFLSHRLGLAKKAKANGFDVHIIAPPSINSEKITSEGFKFHALPMKRKGLNPLSEIILLFRFSKLILRIKPDIYHGFTIKPVVYGLITCQFKKVPVRIVTITGLGFIFLKGGPIGWILRGLVGFLYKFSLQFATKVIFQNEEDKSLFKSKHWLNDVSAEVIPGTGVDINRFSPGDFYDQKPTFIFPARFLRDKGIIELSVAVQKIPKEIDFEVLLCGSLDAGNRASILQAELNKILLDRRFRHLGQVKDMTEVLKGDRVVILPSYREGLSLALLEAAASGLAIITTDVPGCRDVVENGKNGILVPVKDSDFLSKAILRLALSKDERLAMGKRSREIAVQKFDKELVLSRHLEIYKSFF